MAGALLCLAVAGCSPVVTQSAGEFAASGPETHEVMTETVSVAALHVEVPADWTDVSATRGSDVYPVAYALDSSSTTSSLRFSPDYHDATTVSEAVDQVTDGDEPGPTVSGYVNGGSATAQPYPGVASARTAEQSYETESGVPMFVHYWFLEDASTGTIYAVEFRGEDIAENAALVETIDASIALGDA
jgi:hypothetical protein